MRKFLLLTLATIFLLPTNSSHAVEVLTLGDFAYISDSDIWSVEFSRDGNTLHFAENGSRTGLRRVSTSNFLNSGEAVPTDSDGYEDFRIYIDGWQITDLEVSPIPGKDDQAWIYATGGNVNQEALPVDEKSRISSGVVWTINQSTNKVEWMLTKRSSGNWQNGQMYSLAMTPNGKYIYAYGYGSVDEESEVFKYDTETNSQVGLGIQIPPGGSFPVVDNNAVYIVNTEGVFKMIIDADETRTTKDSAPALMTLKWTNTEFDFSKYNSLSIVNDEIYVTSTTGDIAVIDPTTGIATSFSISNIGDNKGQYGLRMGVDGCLYTISTNSSWTAFQVNKINLSTSSVIAATNPFIPASYFQPYWEDAVSMNTSKTIYAITPSNKDNRNIHYVSISGLTCGGVANHSGVRLVNPTPVPDQTVVVPIPDRSAIEAARIAAEREAMIEAAKLRQIEINNYRTVLYAKLGRGEHPLLTDYTNAAFSQMTIRILDNVNNRILQLETLIRSDVSAIISVINDELFKDAFFNPVQPATVDTYSRYGYTSVTERTLAKVNIQVQNLPLVKRNNGSSIQEIANIESFVDQMSNPATQKSVTSARLVQMGLLPADSAYKSRVINGLRSRDTASLDSLEKIRVAVTAELAKIQARKDRTAAVRAKIAARNR